MSTIKIPEPIAPASPARSTPAEEPYPPLRYAWYVVIVLMLIYVNSFLDRQILALLVEPIKKDLQISDKQMGILMGPAFAVFYILAGIPIGRWVDNWSRRWIIGIGQLLWSAMSAGCGVVRTFPQFLGLRMGLGVGEASLSPAAYSLVTDYFPKEKLGTAMSVYSMGIYIGGGLSLVFGGAVIGYFAKNGPWILPFFGEVAAWQMVFFAIAGPVLPLTLLMFTIREPLRRGLKMKKMPDGTVKSIQAPLSQVWEYVSSNRSTYICHNLGFGLLALAGYANSAWVPAFLMRTYKWDVSTVGLVAGSITIVAGGSGIIFAGWLADRLTKRGYVDAKMRVGMIAAWTRIPFGLLYPLMPTGELSALFFIPAMFIASMPFGVAPVAITEMMPGNMRGQGSAIYLFVINLLGMGLGPYILPQVTEIFFKNDPLAVKESLILVTTTAHVGAGILLTAGLKPYVRSMQRLREWNAAHA